MSGAVQPCLEIQLVCLEKISSVKGINRLLEVHRCEWEKPGATDYKVTLASLIHINGIFKLPAIPRVVQSSSLGAERSSKSLMAFSRLCQDVRNRDLMRKKRDAPI